MKKINKTLILVFSLIIIILTILNLKNLKLIDILQSILGIVLLVISLFIGKKLKLSDITVLLYLLFIFQAYVLGNILGLYKKTMFFDTYMHFLTGILGSLLGILLLIKFKKYSKKEITFTALFMIMTVLSISAFWEMIEFSIDHLLKMDTQRVGTGVFDTMKDIISAFLGSILITSWYIYETKNNISLLITKFISNEN